MGTRCEPLRGGCECYTHQDEPDKAFVLDEDFAAQAEFLRSLGLDPDTATHADLLAALPISTPPGLHDCVSCGEPLDGDDPNKVCDECCPCGCPICVHETTGCRACWPVCQIPHADAVAASDGRVNVRSSPGAMTGGGNDA